MSGTFLGTRATDKTVQTGSACYVLVFTNMRITSLGSDNASHPQKSGLGHLTRLGQYNETHITSGQKL